MNAPVSSENPRRIIQWLMISCNRALPSSISQLADTMAVADPGFGKEGFQVTVEAGKARIQTAEGGGREAAHTRGVWGHASP